jgi:voltage-gated potassium channel
VSVCVSGGRSPGVSKTVSKGPLRSHSRLVAGPRRERWEAAADWPLTAAAVLFLIAYALPILKPELSTSWRNICRVVTWGAWALFGVDYLARLALSERRVAFVRRNVPDLAVVVLPLLRPLRLLRLVKLLSVLNRRAGGSLRGRVAANFMGLTSLSLFVASLAVLESERGKPGATINNFGEAIWWAISTVTTVGYGERYPITTAGRFVAAASWSPASPWLESSPRHSPHGSWTGCARPRSRHNRPPARRDVAALTAEIAALRAELRASQSSGFNPESSPFSAAGPPPLFR